MTTIIRSLLMIIAIAAVAGGVTYSQFFSAKEINNNTYSAGTLRLEVGGIDSATLPFSIDNIMPGDDGSKIYYVKNVSNKNAALSIEGFNLLDTDNINTADELLVDTDLTQGELSKNLVITITSNGATVYSGKLSEVVGVPAGTVLGSLTPNEQKNFTVSWNLPFATGNEVQGDRSTMNVKMKLTQLVD